MKKTICLWALLLIVVSCTNDDNYNDEHGDKAVIPPKGRIIRIMTYNIYGRTRHKPRQCSRSGRAGRGNPPAGPRLRNPQRGGCLHQPHGKRRTPGPRPGSQTRYGVALLESHRPRRRRIRRRRAVETPDYRDPQLPAPLRRFATGRGPFAVCHPRRDRRQRPLCRLDAPRSSFGRCEPPGAGQ